MDRRSYFVAVERAGVTATAGCNAVASNNTLSEPSENTESSGKKALVVTSNGEEVGQLGADRTVGSGRNNLSTGIWLRDGTDVDSTKRGIWMPDSAETDPEES